MYITEKSIKPVEAATEWIYIQPDGEHNRCSVCTSSPTNFLCLHWGMSSCHSCNPPQMERLAGSLISFRTEMHFRLQWIGVCSRNRSSIRGCWLAEISKKHIVVRKGKEEALGKRQSRVYSNEYGEQKRNWGVNWSRSRLLVTPGLSTFSHCNRKSAGASSGGSRVIRSQPRLNCSTVTWHLPGKFQLDMDMLQRLEDIRRMDGAIGGLVTTRSVGSRRRRRTITTNAGDVAEKLHTWRSVKWKLFWKYNVGVWEI